MDSIVSTPLRRVLDCLGSVEERNGYFAALCPAHDDHDPSLHIKEVGENDDRKVMLICRAGCDTEKVLKEAGLKWEDLFVKNGTFPSGRNIVAAYDYTSPTGELLHQTVRYEPKSFSQRRPDGDGGWVWSLKGLEPVLYNRRSVMQATLAGETIYILEGEKDCDRAREELGITATTCAMGAEKWRDSYTHTLAGANVILVPDNDEAGRKHSVKVAEELLPFAASVKLLELPGLPEKGDLSDWIDLGGTREELDRLVVETPEFDSAHKGEELGQNESLPVKTVSEVLAESGEGSDWKVKSLLARGNITDLSGEAKLSGKTTHGQRSWPRQTASDHATRTWPPKGSSPLRNWGRSS